MANGCCTNSLFHPFIDTDDTFTHGLWAVLTLPAICCISGIYCIVKAVKETIFWIVVLYIQLKPVELSDKGFYRYHVYLLIDFLTTVALIATGIGLEAGIGVKRCEFISSAVSISLPFPDDIDAKVWWVAAFCMSMDAFIPHIMIVFTIVVFLCVCFTLAHCPDEN